MPEYPDSSDIRNIRKWEFKTPNSFVDFMEFVKSCGKYWNEGSGWGWWQRGRTYTIATGGWSGNEEIVNAMRENFIFWSVCWQKSERGGKYVFILPNNSKTYCKCPQNEHTSKRVL